MTWHEPKQTFPLAQSRAAKPGLRFRGAERNLMPVARVAEWQTRQT
jgi:hypothetical protein